MAANFSAGVEEFPPLPVKRPEPPGLTSRIPSVQGSKEPGIRSSTPKLPPGLNISHAHPSPVASKDLFTEPTRVKSPLQTAGPVTPAVPLLAISQRPLTPKMKLKEAGADRVEPYIAVESALRSVDTDAPSKTTSDKEISLGSPRLKPAQSMREAHNDEDLGLRSPVEAKPDKRSNVPTSRVIDKLSQSKPPAKLDIEAAIAGKASQGSPSDTTMAMPSEFVGTPSVISSRPTTPATMASETPSKASVQRPRTLRVVTGMNQKADTAPASAVTEKSVSILASNQPKQRSRQPSVSSMSRSRPSTPAISEAFSFDASRASSPPPGIIGSAPERLKSKAQQKKDRRDKSRRTTETVDESTNAAISTPAEEVAPVISRQRKQKKRVESSAASEAPLKSPIDVGESVKAAIPVRPKKKDSMEGVSMRGGDAESAAAKVPTQLKRTDSKKSSTPASPKEPEPESQVAQELPGPLYTLRDLYTDAARQPGTSSDFQALLNEHIAPIQKVLASLISNNDIEISNPLFNPPPLSSYRLPGDSRRGADYLDANGYTDSNPFGMVYLSQDKKRAIQNGHAVRISDANKPNDLLRRAMVSPTGTVWRHLSEAEEERVLELEERREVFADEWGSLGLGMMDKLGALEEGDYMNLEGGMEELARAGEVHGVSWILQDDEDDEDGDVEQEQSIRQPFDDELSDDGTDDLGALSVPGVWAVAQALGTVPNNAGITNQANVLPPMKTLPTTSTNLRAMDVETLYKRIAETQRDIEQARKDMDKIEKLCGRKSKEVGKFRDSVLRF